MTLRSSSLVMAALSVLAPGAYVSYFSWRFDQWARAQPGGVCGMPLLGAWGAGLLVMGLLSLVAVALGLAAFIRMSGPRPLHRIVELVVSAVPFLAASSIIIAVLASA